MSDSQFSRRNFIASIAATGAAASLAPLHGLTAPAMPPAQTDPSRPFLIASLEKLTKEEQQMILAVSPNAELRVISADDSTAIAEAEVIFGWVNASILQRAKKLKWVQVWAAGVESMPKEIVEHPLVLTNMQRIFAPVIAETAIGLLLSLTRGIAQFAVPNFNKKDWKQDLPPGMVLDDLYGKTIGIVGMGGIGSETARRLHYGFSMHVLATDAKAMPKPEFVDELHDPGWLMDMVPRVDVLMSAAPLTSETRKVFNSGVFGKMKKSAYFINMSRGGLVDEAALADALKQRRIRGAGLDVVATEPLPADSELWTCPNLVITGHNSGFADIRYKRMMALIVENTRRFTLGLPLMNIVDKQKGY